LGEGLEGGRGGFALAPMDSQKKKLKKSGTFKEIRKFGRKNFDFFLGGMLREMLGNLNTTYI